MVLAGLPRGDSKRQASFATVACKEGRNIDMPTERRYIPVAAPTLSGREAQYVMDCLESSWISSLGGYGERFERAFAELCGTRHAVACSSGTAALHLAFLALGLGPGDEVIVPTLTFVASANAVRYCGA